MSTNILLGAKRMGLSMGELGLLTLQEYVDLCDAWTGRAPGGEREATQADLDRLFPV